MRRRIQSGSYRRRPAAGPRRGSAIGCARTACGPCPRARRALPSSPCRRAPRPAMPRRRCRCRRLRQESSSHDAGGCIAQLLDETKCAGVHSTAGPDSRPARMAVRFAGGDRPRRGIGRQHRGMLALSARPRLRPPRGSAVTASVLDQLRGRFATREKSSKSNLTSTSFQICDVSFIHPGCPYRRRTCSRLVEGERGTTSYAPGCLSKKKQSGRMAGAM